MGGFKYVSKGIDEFTKYKKSYPVQTMGEAVDKIQLHIQSLVTPVGSQIQGLRARRGIENTGEAIRRYDHQTEINLRYAMVRDFEARREDSGGNYEMPARGQRALKHYLGRDNVQRDVPGESDAVLSD